jgi:hypothetical protein
MRTWRELAFRIAKTLYNRIYNVRFDSVEAENLFPDLYKQKITLSQLDFRRWGDIGNTNALCFLCLLAAAGYGPIVEFGTFRGRLTYNLALNLKEGEIFTIDIGSGSDTSNILRRDYGTYVVGEVFLHAEKDVRDKIQLMIGDSRRLDLSHLHGKAGMVIVDGGHSREVSTSDSQEALRLVRPGGVIVWDDYGPLWPGVKQTLDELSKRVKLYYLPREGLVIYKHSAISHLP